MDNWIVALRGSEDALVDARATLGSPVTWLETVQVFGLETADPGVAAQAFAAVVQIDGIAGAVALEGRDRDAARERAVALACAAATGELLFDPVTRARVDGELLFVRPRVRSGWALPVPSVALWGARARRSDSREAVGTLPTVLPLVARQREIADLVAFAATPGVVAVRAARGAGGGRVIEESAKRAGVSLTRVRGEQADTVDGLVATLRGGTRATWWVIDPANAKGLATVSALATDEVMRACTLIVRIEDDAVLEGAREVRVPPLRDYDAQSLTSSLLGAETDGQIVRRLARRGGDRPGDIVQAVRAAVQLGELVPEGARWMFRTRRALRVNGTPMDPVAARVGDLPAGIGRALAVLAAVGDGAPWFEGIGAVRALVSSRPEDLTGPLLALGLLHESGGALRFDASVRALVTPMTAPVSTLRHNGAMDTVAAAEALRKGGKSRDAGVAFAKGATLALGEDMLAPAVRWMAAAIPMTHHGDTLAPALRDAMASVIAALGAVVTIEVLAEEDRAERRTRPLDADQLDQAATHCEERNDAEGASRLRALAEVARGNAPRAMRISGHHTHAASSKTHLVRALAEASTGDLHAAVRTTLGALVQSRRGADRAGEVAALAMLSALYRAAGMPEESHALAEGSKRVGGA